MRMHALVLAVAAVLVQTPATAKSIKMDPEIVLVIQVNYTAKKPNVVLDEFWTTLAATGDRKALSQVAHSACMSVETWQFGLRLVEALRKYPDLKERLDAAKAECNTSASVQIKATVAPPPPLKLTERNRPGGVSGKYDPASQSVLMPGYKGVTLSPDEWKEIESGMTRLTPAFDIQPLKPTNQPSDLVIDRKVITPGQQ